jgi:hypothetical protein
MDPRHLHLGQNPLLLKRIQRNTSGPAMSVLELHLYFQY